MLKEYSITEEEMDDYYNRKHISDKVYEAINMYFGLDENFEYKLSEDISIPLNDATDLDRLPYSQSKNLEGLKLNIENKFHIKIPDDIKFQNIGDIIDYLHENYPEL